MMVSDPGPVEGPLLENTKVSKFQFHAFDRYEIHIQDLGGFLVGSSSLPVHTFENPTVQNFKITKTIISRLRNFKNSTDQKPE